MWFFKEGWEKERYWFYISLVLLAVIIFLGIFIRTTNIPQLKDVTTGEYTLGPDLDPFLYLRLAENIVETGSLPIPDYMRYLGLGGIYKNLVSFDIAYLYKFLSIFSSEISLTYTAIIFPVIFFGLSILTFFFFVREIFSGRSEFEKNSIAVLSALLYSVVPAMQHRTTAGIPELESIGIVFFWLSFFLFLRAWKSDGKILNFEKKYFYAVLAGLSTAVMIYHWGGFRFIFLSLSLTTLIMFLTGRVKKEAAIVYSIWFFISDLAYGLYTNFSLAIFDITTSTPAFFVFAVLLTNLFLGDYFGNKIRQFSKRDWISNELATIFLVSIGGFLVLLAIKPDFTINIFGNIIERLLYPYGKVRTALTVAENIQPYTIELIGMFGKGFFWILFLGTMLIFYETIKEFNRKDKFILLPAFSIFLVGLLFSRYSPSSLFNGVNYTSGIFYFGSMILFFCALIYVYIKNSREKTEKLMIDYNYVFLLVLVLLMMLASKGAIRLLFISSPVFTIPMAFLVITLLYYWSQAKDEFWRMTLFILFLVAVIFFILTFINFENTTSYSVKVTVPSSYTIQWQKAMGWVRENTPEDSIFVHWWDYGYWVQSIGKRATVTDGGHLIGYWDHLTGRYLLTTPNPSSALSLMKSYNVSHLLIDSTDIGKYAAYSRIGSDETGEDRYGILPVMPFNPSQSQNNENSTTRLYNGGFTLDEDIISGEGANKLLLPYGKALLGGIILTSNNNSEFSQPVGAYIYNQKQYNLPIRYLYHNGKIDDFGKGIDAVIMVVPSLTNVGNQFTIDYLGAVIYMSPKTSKSLVAQLYLMNDVNKNYPTIKLVHSEYGDLIAGLKAQGVDIGDFVLFGGGFSGPIKIWEVEYSQDIISHDEFLKKDGEYAEFDNLKFST